MEHQRKQLGVQISAFNKISVVLIDQIVRICGPDGVLDVMKSKLLQMATDNQKKHVPAANYYGEMCKLIPESNHIDNSVGGFVSRHDDVIFSPRYKDLIPSLSAMRLPNKWGMLSTQNREIVWGYLNRLCKLSCEIVYGMSIVENRGVIKSAVSTSLKTGKMPDVEELQRKIKHNI